MEIVQETVLKGFRSIKQLREPELFRTWITRILINVSKDYYRHEYHFAQSLMRKRNIRRKEFRRKSGWTCMKP